MLQTNKYRDNNNFLRHNTLEFTVDRWNLAPTSYEQTFLDMTSTPVWEGTELKQSYNASRDGGVTWQNEDFGFIFGTFFFLSEEKVQIYKTVANITEVIAIVEGVLGLLMILVQIIPMKFNTKQMEAKTIRNCYHNVDHEQSDPRKQKKVARPMKFNLSHKISNFKKDFLNLFSSCLGKERIHSLFTDDQRNYLSAFDRYEAEFNIFSILQTIHKLKACTQVLINDDKSKLLLAKSIYYDYADIHQDFEMLKSLSETRKFLERNEKKLLYPPI